ncbi:aminoacylase-1 [Platysternon megacephalum]|uniref:Aminoacylase-1 n=1 Tax=Platysternon megacephalum TaxID=55544 RepID=A0A4D9E0U6_9SAUR|nr:aminoacylase-1 [Platysternon megacephalum]
MAPAGRKATAGNSLWRPQRGIPGQLLWAECTCPVGLLGTGFRWQSLELSLPSPGWGNGRNFYCLRFTLFSSAALNPLPCPELCAPEPAFLLTAVTEGQVPRATELTITLLQPEK